MAKPQSNWSTNDHENEGDTHFLGSNNAALSSIIGGRVETIAKPGKRDIPPVTLSNIEKVDPDFLRDYITEIKQEYLKYDAQKAAPKKDYGRGSLNRRKSSGISPVDINSSIDSIPSIYKEPGFALENPRVFEIVSNSSLIIDDTDTKHNKTFANNAMLQEKLSYYLDLVEINLIKETDQASGSFFATVGNLQDIEQDACHCVDRVRYLRQELDEISNMQASGGLQLSRLKIRKENILKLKQVVTTASEIDIKLKEAGGFLKNAEFDKVLDIMGNIKQILRDFDSGRKMPITSTILSKEQEFESRVSLDCARSIVVILLNDIRNFAESADWKVSLKVWSERRFHLSEASLAADDHTNDLNEMRKTIDGHLTSLRRIGASEACFSMYRDSIQKFFRSMIRRSLPIDSDLDLIKSSSADSGSSQKSQQLAETLRRMSNENYFEMLCVVFSKAHYGIEKLQVQVKMLLDLVFNKSGAVGDRLTEGEEDESKIGVLLSDLVSTAAEIVLTRLGKIVNVRSNQMLNYRFEDFSHLYVLVSMFLTEIELISGRQGGTFLSNIGSIGIQILMNERDEMIQAQAKKLEYDKWEPVNISVVVQSWALEIIEAAESTPNSWIPSFTEADKNPAPSENQELSTLELKGHKYYVTESNTTFIEAIRRYGQWLTAGGPRFSTEVVHGVCAHARTYNSRIRQMILGAGATRTAGLKNIVAKHIALAWLDLETGHTLLSSFQSFVIRHSSKTGSSSVKAEIDKVRSEFRSHQDEIDKKLIDILRDRLTVASKSLTSQTDWSNADEPSPYIRILMKDTQKLYKALQKYLGESTHGLMDTVLSMIEGQLASDIDSVFRPEILPNLQRDADYYKSVVSDWHVKYKGEKFQDIIDLKKGEAR